MTEVTCARFISVRLITFERAAVCAKNRSSADGKPFAYTFYPNGTYAYAGAMGGYPLATQISESGTYAVSGTDITIQRQSGLIASTNGYRQPLYAQTTLGRVGVVNTQGGPRMVLAFPDGRVFYK